MKIIVGLGNVGSKYSQTRHNLGFVILENALSSKGLKLDKTGFNGVYTIDGIGEDRVLYIEPTTFMNVSGTSVKEVSDFYKVEPKDVLVIHDDKDLAIGQYKIKQEGSSAGQNGIKDIINKLGTQEFMRLRVGIGSNPQIETVDYVMGKFSPEQLKELKEAKGVYTVLKRGAFIFYNTYNKKEYKVNSTHKLRVVGRDLYPIKTFSSTAQYGISKFLPTTSYYQISDYHSGDIIVPYSDYTKLSCDVDGNYFKLNLTNWEADRVYKVDFKVVMDGTPYFFDEDYTFSVVG